MQGCPDQHVVRIALCLRVSSKFGGGRVNLCLRCYNTLHGFSTGSLVACQFEVDWAVKFAGKVSITPEKLEVILKRFSASIVDW